jgi:hypothetical protein
MSPRTRTALAGTLAAAAIAASLMPGCGNDGDEGTPPACLGTPADYTAALAAAPGEVLLQGETPISECLTSDQEGGQLAAAGKSMIAAATTLNADAREDPTGPAAVQLGYLVGAIERGSEGIHADLVRRVNSAARFSPEGLLPPEFERTFGEGYAAGLESG